MDLKIIISAVDRASGVIDKIRGKAEGLIKKAALATGAAIAAGVALSVNAFIKFESAFAGVRKTVEATEEEFALLEKGIRDMAKEIPVTAVELARIGEAAGQLGIETENILSFTRVMADLGVTTNMSSEEAATSLARLANITQMPQENFDRLGSTVVALGNNLATTEAEIVDMTLRLAGAGEVIGLTEAQILGMAGAMSSLGIRSQAGGTSFSKLMIDIASEVETGGDKLADFAEVAGQSVDDFAAAFKEDAAGAMVSFIEGLGDIKDAGGSLIGTLDTLEITESRQRDAVLRLAGAGDLLSRSLDIGTEAWRQNTALTKEASQRYETSASRIQVMKNKINDVMISVGAVIVPILLSMAEAFIEDIIPAVVEFAEALKSDLEPTIDAIVTVVKDDLIPIFEEVVPPLQAVFEKGFKVLIDNKPFILGALAAIAIMLTITLGPAILGIMIAFAPLIAAIAIGGAIGLALTLLIKHFADVSAAITGLVATIGEKIGEAITFVEEIPIIGEIFQGAMAAAQLVVETVFELIKNRIETVIEAIVNIVQFWIAIFKGDWDQAWTEIKELVAGIWDGIKTEIGLILGLIGDLILIAVTQTIPGIIGDAGPLLLSAGKALIQSLLDGIGSMFDNILIPAITKFPARILSALGDIASFLVDAGWNMIKGFVKGMTSFPIPNPLDLIPGGGIVGDVLGSLSPFHEGGIIPAGQVVPAILHGPEAVIPLGRAGALGGLGGGGITITGPLIVHQGPLMGDAIEARNFAREVREEILRLSRGS